MSVKYSTAFKNAILDTESVKDVFDGGFIKVYAGTVPADADAALGGATLLCTYSDNSGAGGLTLAAAAVAGVITKLLSQVWSGAAAATGTGAFWRYEQAGDTGAASTSEKRIQGKVGLGGTSGTVPSLTFTSGVTYTINFFSLPLLGTGE